MAKNGGTPAGVHNLLKGKTDVLGNLVAKFLELCS